MLKVLKYLVMMISFISLINNFLYAQGEPNRKAIKLTRQGNEAYKNGDFKTSEEKYQLAIDESGDYFKAKYNLANDMFRQQRFKEAAESYESIINDAPNDDIKSQVYHNLGNSKLQNKDIDGSIEAYKNALKLNPKDQETRYNLSYSLKLKQQQEQQKKDNKDQQKQDKQDQKNQDKQEQQNQDKQEQQNQDKQEQQNQDKQEQQNQDKQEQQNQDKQDQAKEGEKKDQQKQAQEDKNEKKMNKKEAERILKAMAEKEKDTKEKVDKRKVKVSSVKVEKDW